MTAVKKKYMCEVRMKKKIILTNLSPRELILTNLSPREGVSKRKCLQRGPAKKIEAKEKKRKCEKSHKRSHKISNTMIVTSGSPRKNIHQ